MHRYFSSLWIALLLAGLLLAQQKPAATHAAAKPAASTSLPSEETVNTFLQQMSGYDSSTSWKVVSIKPSEAEGLAEVTVMISNTQGQQSVKLYVTPDGRHAVTGEIIPFGARPFDAARKQLEKGVTGPSRGPADAPV